MLVHCKIHLVRSGASEVKGLTACGRYVVCMMSCGLHSNSSCLRALAASGTACAQCDLWRPLRLPGILVGDGRLGGISTTIAAYECLRMRGYDIPAIVLTDAGLQNWSYLAEHMSSETFVLSLPECPPAPESRCGPPCTSAFLAGYTSAKFMITSANERSFYWQGQEPA